MPHAASFRLSVLSSLARSCGRRRAEKPGSAQSILDPTVPRLGPEIVPAFRAGSASLAATRAPRLEAVRAALHSLVLGRWGRNQEINQRFPGNSLSRRCADPLVGSQKKSDAQPTTQPILFTTFVSPS